MTVDELMRLREAVMNAEAGPPEMQPYLYCPRMGEVAYLDVAYVRKAAEVVVEQRLAGMDLDGHVVYAAESDGTVEGLVRLFREKAGWGDLSRLETPPASESCFKPVTLEARTLPLDESPIDGALTEAATKQMDAELASFGVPEELVGKPKDATYASMKAADPPPETWRDRGPLL